jgi:hypothetical protein
MTFILPLSTHFRPLPFKDIILKTQIVTNYFSFWHHLDQELLSETKVNRLETTGRSGLAGNSGFEMEPGKGRVDH